jgi:hypothetical protein
VTQRAGGRRALPPGTLPSPPPAPTLAHFPVPERWDQGIDTDRQKRTRPRVLARLAVSKSRPVPPSRHPMVAVPARRWAGSLTKRARKEAMVEKATGQTGRHVRNAAVPRWGGRRWRESRAKQKRQSQLEIAIQATETPAWAEPPCLRPPCSLGRSTLLRCGLPAGPQGGRRGKTARRFPAPWLWRFSSCSASEPHLPRPSRVISLGAPGGVSHYEIRAAHCDCAAGVTKGWGVSRRHRDTEMRSQSCR